MLQVRAEEKREEESAKTVILFWGGALRKRQARLRRTRAWLLPFLRFGIGKHMTKSKPPGKVVVTPS